MPTFNSFGDCVLTSKYYRRGRGVKVGDVVSYVHPIYPDQRAIKRVVGLEGDFVLRDTPGKGEGVMIQVRCDFWSFWRGSRGVKVECETDNHGTGTAGSLLDCR